MSNLAYRQSKIQEKRKQTPWRDFVMEICSWHSFNFYKNNNKISRYPKTGREGIVEELSDQYNQNLVGEEPKDNFGDSLSSLWLKTKKGHLLKFFGDENCQYSDAVFGAKNGYLSFEIGFDASNILYSFLIFTNTHNVINSVACGDNSNNLYQCLSVSNSYNIFCSKDINNSNNIWFSNNLVGCKNCILCSNLVNQENCIENIQYTNSEFEKRKLEVLSKKNKFYDYYLAIGFHYENNKFSNDIHNTFWSKYIDFGNNLIYAVGGANGSKYMYDSIDVGINSEHFYGASAAGNTSSHIYCSTQVNMCFNIYNSFHLDNCSFCLGCIGLKNKSYCILNKQYTKEERYEKVDEIFGQMERDGILGQFFPASMNSFYFNDTAAYLIDPSFTKEEVTAKGYLRRNEPIKVDIPEGAKVVKVSELDNYEGFTTSPGQGGIEGVWQINPEILNCIIQDEQNNIYKIVKMEYDFLMKHGLPLLCKHRLDRMKENFRIQ